MNEKPLERLNYYNGRPLDAADFKTEQEYHIRTRRWLNKSLYTAGIARGLGVREVPGKRHVIVSPGLALDSDGREIIVLEETDVEVCSYAGDNESTVVGNYLVIEYSEETLEFEKRGCVTRTSGTSARKSTSHWGGPSRIEATPKFSWVPFVPPPGSNQIVLARVELAQPNCDSVHQIDAGARRYIGAASAAKVRQYALEGERHIDANNPATVYFNIRGQQPNSVSLCLRSEKFSTLFYTELGQHQHSATGGGFSVTIPEHRHTITPIDTPNVGIGTGPAGPYTITYGDIRGQTSPVTEVPFVGPPDFYFTVVPRLPPPDPSGDRSLKAWMNVRIVDLSPLPAHVHSIPGSTEPAPQQPIPLSGTGNSGRAGVSDVPARNDATTPPEVSLTYVDDLHVLMGPDTDNLVDLTDDIRRQLQAMRPTQEDWSRLGGGPTEPDHAFIKKGTGLIRLDFLPNVSFAEGEYVIQLKVASGGGRIHYNLYVE